MFKMHVLIAAAAAALGATAPTVAAAQQAAGAAPAQSLPNRTTLLRNLDSNFKSIDTNSDGSLNQAELATAEAKAQQQRVTALRTQVEAQFTRLDTNRDGQLTRAEFMAAAPTRPTTAATGAALLTQLDRNNDKRVSVDEYRLPMLSGFDRIDTNKDGTVSAAEQQAARAQPRRN